MKASYFLFIGFSALLLFSCEQGGPQNPAIKDSDFTGYFRKTSGVVAADGGFSIPLSDGRSLFLFGDSYIDNYNAVTQTVPCLFQVRNAGLSVGITDPTLQQTYTGTASPASYFHLGTDNAYWFWPQHGYQQGDTIFVFLQRIHHTGGPGGFAFEVVDSNYVAKIHFPTLDVVEYALLPSKNGINFGTSVITGEPGGYAYVYGTKNNGFGNDVFVARFQQNNIYAGWEFYNGSTWSSFATNATAVFSEFTSSFYVTKINGKYVMITTEFSVGCDQGKTIYTQVADHPYGPFTNRKEVWKVDDTKEGHYPMFYLANAHPEFDNGQQELLITYCINGYGTCVETCLGGQMDPDVYRLKAIRVPYSLIGL